MIQNRSSRRNHSIHFHSFHSPFFKRTASNANVRYIRIAVLFCTGLLIFHGFSGKEQKTAEEESFREHYVVIRESMAGREEVPLEEYLTGALAGSVPEDFSPQACRAQAVILRTNVVYAARREDLEEIPYEMLGQESLTVREMQEKWGDAYEAQYEKLKEAVEDTRDQILSYQGDAVFLPFFPLSAGSTRDAGELWPEDTFPYLKSVSCGEDIFSDQYEQEMKIGEHDLEEILGELFGAEAGIPWEELECIQDSTGYVTELIREEEHVSGESFRKKAGLASSCFTVEKEGSSIYITTKGIGHGLGMSQYTAGVMAEEGKDYREILAYFFPDCVVEKI